MKDTFEMAKEVSELSKEEQMKFLANLQAFIPANFEEYVKKDFLLDWHYFGTEADILAWLHK